MNKSQLVADLNFRQKGRTSSGRVVKGVLHQAPLKLKLGSIPTAYETIVYKQHSLRAFGSSANRFIQQTYDLNQPGPGTYAKAPTARVISDQHQKKGPFISRSERNPFKPLYVNTGPGPNSYAVQKKTHSSVKSIKFGRSARALLSQNLKGLQNPGPGQYQPLTRNSTLSYRFSKLPIQRKDKTITSNIDFFVRKQQPKKIKIRQFQSKEQSKSHLQILKKYLVDKADLTPGPGAYQAQGRSARSVSFSRKPTDRMTEIKGAGVAAPIIQPAPERLKTPLSCMKSRTERRLFSESESKYGPGLLTLDSTAQKRAFNINLKRNWI